MLKQSAAKNTLIFVGADKGGVGKTMLARLLLDYLGGVSVRAFDTEPIGAGVLKRFYPSAKQVNLTQSQDQALIVDGLGAARVTLVDIAAGLLSPTLHLFQRIGFKQGVDAHLCVMHVLGNTVASLGEIKNTTALIAGNGGDHVLVKNHAAGSGFFEWDAGTAKELAPYMPERLIGIGHLDVQAAERVDKSNQMFSAFVSDAANSRLMRGLVRAWQAEAVAEFARIGLINLVS